MKKIILLINLLILAVSFSIDAQSNSNYARNSFAEKIYLQTDNNVYTNNSTIWFKALVVNTATLSGIASSKTLYVNLVSNNKILDSKIIKLKEGIGSGYFDLGSSVNQGQYLISAYTEWNKNFSDNFNFLKPIKVISVNTDETETPELLTSSENKTLRGIDNDTFDIQFFPEGGEIISGINSKVGFKAIGLNGMGVKIEGEIIDSNNNRVAVFKSNKLGIGHFIFNNPESSMKYRARITRVNDKKINSFVDLPKINSFGYAMNVSDSLNSISVKVKSNLDKNAKLSLKGFSRGITYVDNKLELVNGSYNFSINKKELPQGIIVFTIYDDNQNEILERLFFNRNDMSMINLSASTNKEEFSTREEITISVSAKNKFNNTKDLYFDTSILVLDSSRIDNSLTQNQNVLSYLLLTSDLKGFIESPSAYFNNISEYSIDDLMLTQGWRNYKYNEIVNNNFQYNKETGIPIKGLVSSKNLNYQNTEKDFLVMNLTNKSSIFTVRTVVPSNFYFEIDNLKGDFNKVVMEPIGIPDKEKREFDIIFAKKKNTNLNLQEVDLFDVKESIQTNIIEKQRRLLKIEKDNFKDFYGGNRLEEVVIYGYNMTPKRREMADKYGLPNTVIDGKEIKEKTTNYTSGLQDVLIAFRDRINVKMRSRQTIMDPTILRIGTNQGGKNHVNMVLVDGVPVNAYNHDLIDDINPSEVTSVEVIDGPKKIKFLYAEVFNTNPPPGTLNGSIISIYTRNGKGLFGALKPNRDMNVFNLRGYSLTKEFYSPKYNVEDNYFVNKPDYRTTIYWEPHLRSKSNENSEIKFFHSDDVGEFIIFLETISSDGKIGYKEINYSVNTISKGD